MALITRETASSMGRRGNDVRWHSPKPVEPEPEEPRVAESVADYATLRLIRVRKQLDAVDDAIELAIGGDSKSLKELTDAQMRLAEQERILAGRPMPGSLKPTSAKPSSSSTGSVPDQL